MKDFKFPKSVTIELPNLGEDWIKENPLLISFRSFAKNKITEDNLWGGIDHRLDMIMLKESKTVLTGEFLKNYDSIHRDLSSMEIRPIEFHYSLIEIELMNQESLKNWMNYLKESKNFFAYEKVLGTVDQLMEQVRKSGNSSVEYLEYFHKIRDLWNSETESKEYKFEFEKKK